MSRGISLHLPEGSFSASASYVDNADLYGPKHCRIGVGKKENCSHAWICKSIGDVLTVDLCDSYLVTGVVTQGRGDAQQWITQYSVQTSENGVQWSNQGDFIGNFDNTSLCKRRFKKPVIASFVRFVTTKFHHHPTMRVDVLVYDV